MDRHERYGGAGQMQPGRVARPDPESPEARRSRARGLLKELGKIALLGGAYFIWLSLTGLGIPCPIRLVTGYLCPGCGITHCCMALAHLDFEAAFQANALVLCLLPAAIPYGIYRAVLYVRHGERELSLPEIIIFSLIMVVAVCFALYRNGFLL